ncbi:HD domain-containing protein [Roseburia hominis]
MMDYDSLMEFMKLAEQLKCNTRHSFTSSGRPESVAEHCWRLMLFAWLMKEEFPQLHMKRVLELCLFHDMGEAITGDVPCFEKGEKEQNIEQMAISRLPEKVPEPYRSQMADIFREIEENRTPEAQLLQALDKMEAVIQHNEADISTWLPLEYDLQLQYGQKQADAFAYTRGLRDRIYADSVEKIEKESGRKLEKEEGF